MCDIVLSPAADNDDDDGDDEEEEEGTERIGRGGGKRRKEVGRWNKGGIKRKRGREKRMGGRKGEERKR